MAIQSYADIMARLNNPYGTMTEQPRQTVADDFTKYVQTLLLDPNPQGGMLDRDPFRRQNEIDARIKREQEAKAAQAAASAGGGGMFGGSSSGGGGDSPQGYSSWMDAKEGENELARQERIAQWAMENPIQAKVMGYFQNAFATHPLGLLQEQMAPGTQDKYNINDITNRVRDTAIIAAETRKREAAAAEMARQQEIARQQAQAAAAAQAAASYYDIQPTGDYGGGFQVTSGDPYSPGGTGTITSGGLGYSVTGGGADM